MVTNITELYGSTLDELTDEVYDEQEEEFDGRVLDFMMDRNVLENSSKVMEDKYGEDVADEFRDLYNETKSVEGLLTGCSRKEPEPSADYGEKHFSADNDDDGSVNGLLS